MMPIAPQSIQSVWSTASARKSAAAAAPRIQARPPAGRSQTV